ncbi:MAG: isoprenylcysteine carboxylmethyltransferase family protein [Pseudolabrys sp.]
MPKSSTDHPKVIVFPPIILATTIALGSVLQWLWPIGLLATAIQTWRIPVGVAVILAGVLLAATGRRTLVRLGTLQPTTALATDGVFGWTRNPLYSGGMLVIFGIALVFALDWLLLIVPSLLVLHFGVVKREEEYLERKFGDRYRIYRSTVARYGLGI